MGLSKADAIKLFGTEAYTGWDRESAQQDFNAKNKGGSAPQSSSGGGGFDYSVPTFDPNSIPVSQPTLTSLNVNLEDYINAIRETLPEPPEEYLKANPFYFDEQAAKEVSSAEFSPYYDELLQDYLGEAKLTSEKYRGDATRMLAELDKQKELFYDQHGRDFEKTLRGIKEGYSSKNLYLSGFNKRDQEEAQDTSANKIEGYMNTYGSKRGGVVSDDTFKQQQIQTLSEQKARDIGREKTASIYGGVNTQKNEAIDEYLYGMQTYYKNPNWKSLAVQQETGNTNLS
jgi:hypothetical protein